MEEIQHRQSNEEATDQHKSDAERHPDAAEIYREGEDVIIENEDGDIIGSRIKSHSRERRESMKKIEKEIMDNIEHPVSGYKNLRKKLGVWRHKDDEEQPEGSNKFKTHRNKHGPALAYQFGNTVRYEMFS